eukprot:jgi/Ulvmu1/8537/UM044_0071.1
MPWSLLSWILCFFLQAGLVGIVFYTLIQLYDFEEDLLNNSDCAKRCNRFVYVEAGLQVAVLIASLLSGHIIASAINIVGTALIAERMFRGKHRLDALELWKQLPAARRFTYMKLAAFCLAFVFTTFRMIEIVVHEVLSDHGRYLLKHILRDAMRDTVHY